MSSPFLQSIRSACRVRGYSLRTENTYVYWTKQYIYFINKKHPADCGSVEVAAFLGYLAETRHVSVNTQKLALNALVFTYKHVVKQELGKLGFTLARKQRQLPTVLSSENVQNILCCMSGRNRLIFQLLYGSGLRISECLRLRVKDLDCKALSINVHDGKGRKNRQSLMSRSLRESIGEHIGKALLVQRQDAEQGVGVAMPPALARKYSSAPFSPAWAFLFPSSIWSEHPLTGQVCRYHLDQSVPRKALKRAVADCGLLSHRINCHTCQD